MSDGMVVISSESGVGCSVLVIIRGHREIMMKAMCNFCEKKAVLPGREHGLQVNEVL